MKKRLITCLLAAALLLPAGGAGAESSPLVYRVWDDAGSQIYLLGTIHVGSREMYPLGEAVERAYREADALAVELDLYALNGSLFKSLRYTFAMVYPLGESIRAHISEETYALGVEKLGLNEAVIAQMRPAMWLSLAENYLVSAAGLDAMQGVDYTLLRRAHADGKAIHELESLEDQMQALLSIPEDVIDEEVGAMLASPEEAAEGLRALYEAWRTGNEGALCAILAAQGEDAEEELAEEYEIYGEVLITGRNAGFLEKAVEYLKNGNCALIAVGAFHIVGPEGLAAQLAKAGYHVERVEE